MENMRLTLFVPLHYEIQGKDMVELPWDELTSKLYAQQPISIIGTMIFTKYLKEMNTIININEKCIEKNKHEPKN